MSLIKRHAALLVALVLVMTSSIAVASAPASSGPTIRDHDELRSTVAELGDKVEELDARVTRLEGGVCIASRPQTEPEEGLDTNPEAESDLEDDSNPAIDSDSEDDADPEDDSDWKRDKKRDKKRHSYRKHDADRDDSSSLSDADAGTASDPEQDTGPEQDTDAEQEDELDADPLPEAEAEDCGSEPEPVVTPAEDDEDQPASEAPEPAEDEEEEPEPEPEPKAPAVSEDDEPEEAVQVAATTAPSKVRNLSATARTDTTISLSWSADALHDKLHDYQLQRRRGSGDWTTIFFDQKPATSFQDKGLRAGTEYQYRVRARLTVRNEGPYSDVLTVSTRSASTGGGDTGGGDTGDGGSTGGGGTSGGTSGLPSNYPWVGQPTRAGSANEAFSQWHQVNSESPGRLDAIANTGALPSFVRAIGRARFSNAGGSQRARAIFEHSKASNINYWTEGSEIWYGGFFYFQPGFRSSLNSSVDFHRWDAYVDGSNDMQGGLGVRSDGRLRIQNNWPYREPLVSNYVPPEGRWLHIEVGQKLSSRSGGGWSEIWVNGERIARSTNANYYGDRYSGNAARINRHRIGLFGSAQRNPIELQFAYQTIGSTRHGDPRR